MIFKICHSPNVKNIKVLSNLYTMNCRTNISMHSSKGNLKTKNKQTKQIKTTINHRFKPFFCFQALFNFYTFHNLTGQKIFFNQAMFWLRCCLLAGFHNFFLQKNQSGNNDDKLYGLPSGGIKTKFPDHSDLFGILSKFWLINGTLPSESRNLLKQKIGKNSWNLMFAVGFTYCFEPEYRDLLYLRSTMTHEAGS